MALILSIETSTPVCSVAITEDSGIIAFEKLFLEKSHSNLLTVVIESLLVQSNLKAKELDAVAVSEGPGSYTGLRIGVSTAKGLCYAMDKPLIAVQTLKAMAHEVNKFNTEGALLAPMLDARRMEVYCAMFDTKLDMLEEVKPLILDEQSFVETLTAQRVLFFGDGSDKFRPLMEGNTHAAFISDLSPSAWAVGQLASEKYVADDFEDVAYFEPFYLKEFQATVPKALL